MKRTLVLLIFICLTIRPAQAQSISSWKAKDVVQYMDTSTSVLVINFWATFCKPCVAEIPYLENISRRYRSQNVKVLLVSLDLPDYFPARIESFVKKNKYASEVAWLNETNANYFCPAIDKKWMGVIPGYRYYQ